MPFTVLQSAFDALYPAGLQWYWKANFFTEIADTAIDAHLKYGAQLHTGHSTMHLYPINGAASREALHPTSVGGGYINFMMSEGHDPIVASYRRNYDRLARVKARYERDSDCHTDDQTAVQAARRAFSPGISALSVMLSVGGPVADSVRVGYE